MTTWCAMWLPVVGGYLNGDPLEGSKGFERLSVREPTPGRFTHVWLSVGHKSGRRWTVAKSSATVAASST